MFQIGDFSKMSRTTVKTLRYYDEAGLLKPETTDTFSGYRLYTTEQLLQLHRIQALRQAGLSIEEIRLILTGGNTDELLKGRRSALMDEIDDKQAQLSRIKFILQGNEERQFMNYHAAIKQLPECIVYSTRTTIPSYDSFYELLPAINKTLQQKYPDIKCAVPKYCFVAYHDKEYKEKDIDVEYCEAVDRLKPDFDNIRFKKLQSIPAASVMHKGSYNELSKAYAYAFKWIEENGYKIVGAARESYIDGPWNKQDEADWLTELQIPIELK